MERVTEAALKRQRTIQTTLLFIILATLPCYCLGAVLLLTSPSQRGPRTATLQPTDITATVAGAPTNTPLASITPFQIPTANTLVSPLQPTPTQIFLFPTVPPTLTFTPFFPTHTPVVLPSVTPIIILPTSTPLHPTSTPFIPPSFTPVLGTNTPLPLPTLSSGITATPTLAIKRPATNP